MNKRNMKWYTEEAKKKIEKHWIKWNMEQMEREIFNSCIFLKNLAIVYQDRPMSGDFILEELMSNSKHLRNVYADILSAYRNGKGEEAISSLQKKIPIKSAKRFTMILLKIDQINPSELISYMTSFEEAFAGERMTKGMKRAERKSLITTMVATASIFAILLNFVIVFVFLDTLSMLREIV
ncbi:hypothetical protein M2140_000222 [Clostridiales Family XIII bacterium PM5-7]